MKLFAWETPLPTPDLEACKALRPGPGRVAVEMSAQEQERFGLVLTRRESDWRRPCLAVVLAAGELPAVQIPTEGMPRQRTDTSPGWPWVREKLEPGQAVFIRTDDGKRIENCEIGGYKAKEEVRLLGISSPRIGSAYEVPLDESILGVWDPMTRTARAFGRRLLLKLGEKKQKTESGVLWLPDWLKTRNDVAEVLSAGAQVFDYKPADQVVYNRRALHEIHSEDGVVYAFILEEGVYGKVDERESGRAEEQADGRMEEVAA